MSKAIKDTLWVAAANGMLLVLRILMLPYLVRTLSKTEYGTYGQVLLVVELLIGILGLGVARGIYVVYAAKQYDRQSVFQTAFTVLVGVGLLGYGLVLFFRTGIAAQFGNPQVAAYLPMYGLAIAIQVPATVLTATLLYFERPRRTVLATVLQTAVTLGVLFAGVSLGDLRIAFWGMSAAAALQFLYLGYCLRGVVGLGFAWHRGIVRALYRASWGTAVAVLFAFVGLRVGELIVGATLGVEEYALYRAGAFELPFFSTVYASISTVLAPRIAQLYYAGSFQEIVRLKRRTIAATAVLLYPVYIYFFGFGDFLVGKYLGANYAASGWVFVLFNAALLVRITEYSDVLVAAGKQGYILRANLAYILFSIASGYLAAEHTGILGVAAVHTLGVGLLAGLLMVRSAKLLGTTIFGFFDARVFRLLLLSSLATITPLVLVFQYVQTLWLALAAFVAFSAGVGYLTLRYKILDAELVQVLTRRLPFTGRLLARWYPQ